MEHHWIPVEGNSMYPFLISGDLISVDWKPSQKPQLGELILGKSNGLWVVHRMIGKKNENFLIKGDSSYTCDELTQEEVWGKVIAWKKWGSEKPVTHQTTSLDRLIALFGRYRFRRIAKVFALIKRLWSLSI